MASNSFGSGGAKRTRCPTCGAQAEHEFRPFCSRRCADIDLSRWLRGTYAIPGGADEDEDGVDPRAKNVKPGTTRPEEDSEDDG